MTNRNTNLVNIRRLSGLFVLVLCVTLSLMVHFDVVRISSRSSSSETKDNTIKYILLWNKFHSDTYYGLGKTEGRDMLLKAKCPINTCYVTADRTLMPVDRFDALIFHVYHLKKASSQWFWKEELLPTIRSPHQRYVFLLFETPIYAGGDMTLWKDYFNWTWTYRSESDIYSPYGRVINKDSTSIYPVLPPLTWLTPDNEVESYYEVAENKTRLIAWLVSHCDTQSKREKYVKELSANIAVDYFGHCGGKHWPKSDLKGFYKMMNSTYKFYMSFENSLCKEYVTEKFFNILNYDVVPIVYGDAEYKTIAPPMSFINVLDYSSPKELATYLKYLDENPKEYAKYFWWKKHYRVSNVQVPQPESLCKLCELLHSDLPTKIYPSMHNWWTADEEGRSMCRDPTI